MITKEQFKKLAKAYIKQEKYEDEITNAIYQVAKENEQETDFLGLPCRSGYLLEAILDILGDDFCYYHYDCENSFTKFSKNITYKDGSHPNVKTLDDLYDFAVEEGSIK